MMQKATPPAYLSDLAYIHDAGYTTLAAEAAMFLQDALQHQGFHTGRIIDLGCGSGTLAKALLTSGYDILGIDISPAMIALAQQNAPQAQFQQDSLFAASFPSCVAVCAIGECFNYLFDTQNTDAALFDLCQRIYAALSPGGIFLFDVIEPGRIPSPGEYHTYRTGDDWAVLVHAKEDREHHQLTRHITTFRQVGTLYRRSEEVHTLRLLPRQKIRSQLLACGFWVKMLKYYGSTPFGHGHIGFFARKIS